MEKKISNILNILAIFLIVFSIFFVSFEQFYLKTTFIWLIAMILIFCNIVFFKEKINWQDKVSRWLILFDILLCILSIFSNNIMVSLKFIIWFSSAIFAYCYFKEHLKYGHLFYKLISFFSLAFAYITILSIIFEQAYFNIIHFLFSIERYETIISLYNQSCYSGIAGQTGNNAFLIIIGILVISTELFVKDSSKKSKGWNIYNLFVLITALILCNKRMLTILGVLLLLIVIIIANIDLNFKEKFKNLGLYIVYILYIGILLFGFPNTFKLFSRSMEYFETDVNKNPNIIETKPNGGLIEDNFDEVFNSVLNGRGALYKKALLYFKNNPIIGIGIDNYTYYEHIQTHNSVLQLLCEIGLLGTIPLLCILIYIFVESVIKLFKYYKNPLYVFVFCSELLILAYSLTGNPFHDFNIRNYYFIVIGFMFGIINNKNSIKDKGILTFHLSQNYGAVLQTYALNKKLKNSEIINYYSSSVYDYYDPFNIKKYGKFKMVNVLKMLYNFKDGFLKRLVFNKFRNDYLDCSEIIYNKNNLPKMVNKYYKVITGSDQVWNSAITLDDDYIYYLNFPTSSQKYSYAASIGSEQITKIEENKLKENIHDYAKITVREESAKDILEKLNIKSSVIIDPTLLLTSKEWDKISVNHKLKEKYILVYCLDKTKEFIECVNKASYKYHLKVVHFDKKNTYKNELKNYPYASPNEFITLIKGAKYVITNSFHGTVFALLYHKQFISIPHSTRSTRQQNLLNKLALEDRLTYDIDLLDKKYDNSKIDDYRNQGLKYIEELNKNDEK